MKRMTKLIAVISIVALLASAFVSCASQGDRVEHDGKEFTFWTSMDAQSVRSKLESYDDMLMFQEFEKATGVHINFQHPVAGSNGNEAFIGMINSDNRAELVQYWWKGYPGGPQQAIADGIILALNDYLEEYAPNFFACVEGDPDHFIFQEGLATAESAKQWKLQATTDEGEFYGFNVLNVGTTRAFNGLYVRADKLKEWNMDVPDTIDDWTAFFAKAKAEGFEKPFTSALGVLSFTGGNAFNTAFNVGKNFYLEGDKVVFGPFMPGFKEYVAQMAEWVKAGYIDSGFVTNESEVIKGNVTNGISAASFGYIGGDLGTIIPAARVNDPDFDLVACPLPGDNEGNPQQFKITGVEASDCAIAITYNCGNYEKAMEWIDYRYSKEGSEINIFGVEGYTYTKEKDEELGRTVYTYTDMITHPDPAKFNSVEESLYHFMLPCNHPGFNQHPDYLQGYYPYQSQKDAINTWNISAENATKAGLPPLSNTQEEFEQIADITEVAQAPLEAAICNIMLGKASIDTFDAAIETAKPHYEKYIAIQQTAYDRYMSKLNK